MDINNLSNSKIADYKIGTIYVDYQNSNIIIEMYSPKNEPDTLSFTDFTEFSISNREPWGLGLYVAASNLQITEEEVTAEIQLNSGDVILIKLRHNHPWK